MSSRPASGLAPALAPKLAVMTALLVCSAAWPGAIAGAAAATPAATASAAASSAGERQRIREGRAATEARLVERERECQDRFVVTSCVDAAKREYRDAMAVFQARQRVLDEADRKRNAALRLESLEKKAAGDDAEHAESPRRQPAAPVVRVRPPATPGATRDAGADLVFGTSPKPAAERRADEARSVSDFEARKKAADEHRKAVERRNAERAAKSPPPAPLPTP